MTLVVTLLLGLGGLLLINAVTYQHYSVLQTFQAVLGLGGSGVTGGTAGTGAAAATNQALQNPPSGAR